MTERIIYFGTSDVSVPVLFALARAGYEIAAVVTQPDKPKGRDCRRPLPPAVKLAAEEIGTSVLQPASMKDEGFLADLAALKARAFCVFSFGRILPQRLLDLPPLGCFNAHASLLPRWRGAAPINRAILNGDLLSGLTVQRMVFKLDAGPVVWRTEFPLDPAETGATLFEKMIPLAGQGLIETLGHALTGTLRPEPQDDSQATYAPPLSKEESRIDWSNPARLIDRQIRGLLPWPVACARLEGDWVRIFDAVPLNDPTAAPAPPGTVVQTGTDGLVVACGEGHLKIREVQKEGRKRMKADAFLCGSRLKAGCRFE